MTTGKTIALTRQTFVGKVMPLLFNKLSRLVTAFLPRSKSLLISWLQSPPAVILEPKKIVSHYFHCLLIYLPWSDGTRCYDLVLTNQHLPHVATITGSGKACDLNHWTHSYVCYLKNKTKQKTAKKHSLFYWGNWNDEMYMWRWWKPIYHYGGRICWREEPTQKKQK